MTSARSYSSIGSRRRPAIGLIICGLSLDCSLVCTLCDRLWGWRMPDELAMAVAATLAAKGAEALMAGGRSAIGQAGAIHGNVHFHEPAAEIPVPHQLPAASAYFVSRVEELAWLDAMLDEHGCGLMVLSGPGGVGKTALAMWWAHRVRDRLPGGQLYVDLGGFSGDEPVDPREALGGFLRALGVAPQRVPAGVGRAGSAVPDGDGRSVAIGGAR